MFKSMLSALASASSAIFGSWTDMKKSKYEAEAAYNRKVIEGEQEWDLEAQRNAKYSWKDEFIMMIWYSPLIIGWWDREAGTLMEPMEWVDFVGQLPYWWQFGAFGIMAASFGLRWYFKSQNFKITKDTTSGES